MTSISLVILFLCSFFCIQVNATEQIADSTQRKVKFNKSNHHIKLDMRFDLNGSLYSQDENQFAFKANALKLVFEGNITPNISYLLRQRLNRIGDIERDNLLAATDFALINFGIGKKWAITVGKQPVQAGTFEFEYNPTMVYFWSQAIMHAHAYATGVNFQFKHLNNEFNLQVTNGHQGEIGDRFYKNSFNYAAHWVGNLFNDTWRTRYGYLLTNITNTCFTNTYTFGNQLAFGRHTLDLDYINTSGLQQRNEDLNKAFIGRDLSYIANYKVELGEKKNFVWGLKGTIDRKRDAELDLLINKRFSVSTSLAYYPLGREHLHVFIAYGYTQTNFIQTTAPLALQKENQFLGGVRWLFEVF